MVTTGSLTTLRRMPFATDRYDHMTYRRCGRSGLMLPAVSLGGWQAIGSYTADDTAKRIYFRAFDRGITHFDFANNYGTPAGASESLFGKILKEMPREELVISSKAGWRMWPGPYGDWGSRKYIIESCEQSLKRLGVDHVDIFYSHRPDPDTPIEETLGALDQLVRQGKALYAGISNYNDPVFTRCLGVVDRRGWAPITISQPRYNIFFRQSEKVLLPTAETNGVGVIVYSPLCQGLLSDRYLDGAIPSDSRAASTGAMGERFKSNWLTPAYLAQARALRDIARARGQTLSQMALSWLLKDQRVTSVLIGASKVEQLDDNLGCLKNLAFSASELAAIDTITGPCVPPL